MRRDDELISPEHSHVVTQESDGEGMIPGEIIAAAGSIELNAGRETVRLSVANTGDRPVQVGSHYHFYETNPAPFKN